MVNVVITSPSNTVQWHSLVPAAWHRTPRFDPSSPMQAAAGPPEPRLTVALRRSRPWPAGRACPSSECQSDDRVQVRPAPPPYRRQRDQCAGRAKRKPVISRRQPSLGKASLPGLPAPNIRMTTDRPTSTSSAVPPARTRIPATVRGRPTGRCLPLLLRDQAGANWITTLMSSGCRCNARMNSSGCSRRVTRRPSHARSARANTSPALYQ